jgi:hypothetical protein
MNLPRFDLAQVRLDNALLLFDEFVQQAARHPDAATLRGLEGRFAERLQIQPSYWSQIKSRSRQIGERLARQFEQQMRKPYGWMDAPQPTSAANERAAAATDDSGRDSAAPQSDDERFIVGLVLTYYRRHPQRARQRLLDLLGEVLVSGAAPTPAATTTAAPSAETTARSVSDRGRPAAVAGDIELWQRTQAGVAPLRRRRGV